MMKKKTSCRGCSFKNTIDNCWSFHSLYPEKKSGYYWVNHKCSKKPYRVYCDFLTPDK